MDPNKIPKLLQPFLGEGNSSVALSSLQLNQILTYINMLLRWNSRMNLTSVRDHEKIVTRHFGESLFAARHLFPSGRDGYKDVRVIDLGSGAGFPGVPIKIWAPWVSLILIESNGKKAVFLREVVRGLQLSDVTVEAKKAEEVRKAQADIVTLRAVEKFDAILPIGTELAKQGGRLALLVGEAQTARAASLAPAVRWQKAIPIPLSSRRALLTGFKVEF